MSHTYKYNISLNVAAARERNHMEYFYGHVHNFYGHGVFIIIVHLHDVTAYWCFGWSPAAARARFFHDIVTEKTALSVRKFIETQ